MAVLQVLRWEGGTKNISLKGWGLGGCVLMVMVMGVLVWITLGMLDMIDVGCG